MNHQVDTGRGRQVNKEGREVRGGRGYGGGGYRGRTSFVLKAFKFPIVDIASDTFNMGQSKFAAQFTLSRRKNSSYTQRSVEKEAYLVAQTIRTGVLQTIDLPPTVPGNYPDADNFIIVREEVVRAVAKRRITLNKDLKKGFATLYDQCSQEVRDNLESSDGWETIQRDQSLHELIFKIERICVGFDDHKQEVYNLVQAMKTLFLYTQTEKESVEDYSRNLTSMWYTAKAFGAYPRIHRGLVGGWLLAKPRRIVDVNNITDADRAEAET